MSIRPEELYLNESYDFDVTIETKGGKFAGTLKLSPQRITLTIMGEQHAKRKCDIVWQDIETLICKDTNTTFFLMGLRNVEYRGHLIEFLPQKISYFESKYEVENVIYCPTDQFGEIYFTSINIHSKTVREWLGNTIKQENIIGKYKSGGNLFNDDSLSTEFSYKINNFGLMGIHYNTSLHHSSPAFKAGIVFPPSLFLIFESLKTTDEIINTYYDLYTLLSFLTGDELEVEKINASYMPDCFSKSATIYYPREKMPKRNEDSCILFPLSKNLRFDTLCLPELPLSIFDAYFGLDDTHKGYMRKYFRYRRMENVEERFLGYFRILESLCYIRKDYLEEKLLLDLAKKARKYLIKKFGDKKGVDSFIKNLSWFNSLKYNTEKCLQEFFKKIPSKYVEKWKFGKSDIGRICKLRNDITHANNYYTSEAEIEAYAKFVEVLLILALFLKLGVNLEQSLIIINRLNGFLLITNN